MKLIAITEANYNDIEEDLMRVKANLSAMNVEARDKPYNESKYWSYYQDVIGRLNDLENKINDDIK